MENHDLIEQQKQLLKKLQERQEYLRGKFGTKGFVVAGYGGDTLYSFVGEGNGFQGAALVPMSRKPRIFFSKTAAKREAYNGTYRNGNNDVICLNVWKASDYYHTIYEEFEKSIKVFKEQYAKL